MRRKAVKPLVLNKETLRNLADLPGKALAGVVGASYPLNCSVSNCASCGDNTKRYCCL
jgi:hypothetical protein